MLRLLGAPFFAVYLIASASPTLLKLAWPKLRLPAYLLIFVSLLFLITGGSWLFYTFTVQQTQISPTLKRAEYVMEYDRVRALLESQPTHRDLLWNAAILAEYVGDSSAAAEYRQRAQQVDPNFPSFQ